MQVINGEKKNNENVDLYIYNIYYLFIEQFFNFDIAVYSS